MINRINFARNAFLRSTVSAFVLGGAMLTGISALAATVEVPDGTNLNMLTPVSGDIWNLQGNDFLSDGINASYSKALPAALIINGIAGGSSITMNDAAGHYGYFAGSNLTLSLSDVVISGGKQEMGGAINASSLILNTTGTVAFNNNGVNAVAANSLGYGGAIYTSVGGVKVNGNFSASDNSSGSSNKKQYSGMGGAVYSSAEFIVSGSLELKNNTTTEAERAVNYINTYAGLGGGVYAGGAVSVAGSVIADGNRAIGEQAGGAGGAIYSKDGSVSLAQESGDVILTNNYASQRGGAISSQLAGMAAGTMNLGNINGRVLIGVDASGNAGGNKTSTVYQYSAGGGALYSAGAVNITGREINISNNYTSGQGGALYAAGGLIVNGDLVANNNVGEQAGGVAQTDGEGGVRINGSLDAHNNSAGVGGVFNAGTGITVTGSVNVTGNSAINGHSGVFYVFGAGATVSLAATTGNVVATDNFSDSGGGGVIGRGNVIAGNAAGTVEFSRNWAGYDAAGNQLTSYATGGAINVDTGTITLIGTTITFDSNKASSSGGAVYGRNGLTATGHLIVTDNRALGSGGAIMINNADIISNGSATVTGNASMSNGGAIMVRNVTLGADGAVIELSNNSAGYMNYDGTTSSTPVSEFSSGGAVFSTQSITLKGATIALSNNKTGNMGGGLYANQNVTITGDLTADANNARTSGGAVYTGAGNIQINGSVDAEGNTAGQTGSVFNAGYGNVLVSADLVLNKNATTTGNGGAIFANGSVTAGKASGTVTFVENTAGASGGGIYANNVTLDGSSITFTDNRANSGGGAVYSNGNVMLGNAASALEIAGNAALGGVGGAVMGGNAVTLKGATIVISDNHAQTNGGAIYGGGNVVLGNADSAVEITGNSTLTGVGGAIIGNNVALDGVSIAITNNNAKTSGGAIYGNGNVSLGSLASAVEITGNSALGGVGGAINGNDVTLDGLSIAITDNNAKTSGGAIYGNGSVTLGSDATKLEMTGNAAQGGIGGAVRGNNVSLNGSSIEVSDNTATSDGGAIAALGNVAVTAMGATNFTNNVSAGKGGAIWVAGNATLSALGGDITFSGNTHEDPIANAIWFGNGSGGATATFDAEAGRTIAFFDPIQNNDANGLMAVEKTGAGMVSFDGSKVDTDGERWSKMFAKTTVSEGTFEVANEAVYGAFSTDAIAPTAATSFTSNDGTMVRGGRIGTIKADDITLNGNLSIAGRQSDTRGVFNLSTNNLTLGGGTVYFNTHLDDGSSGDTDMLVLNLHGSATSGQSFINVANAGGAGAVTVGDGIKLVETNGTGTTNGAFMLGERVASGAYEYFLFQGGKAATGGDANDQNWYLRSIDTNPPAPGCEETGTCFTPVAPPAPLGRPEVLVNTAIMPLAIEYGYAMLDTLHERVGDSNLRPMAPVTEERVVWCKDASRNFKCVIRVPANIAKDETRWTSSGWARLIGNRGEHKPNNFEKRGPDYDYTFGGIQAGLDIYANEQADGTLDKAGIYVGYGQITSDVSGPYGLNGVKVTGKAGSVDMDAYTVGGYWTHKAASGWYSDAVIQGTWYSADAHSVLNQHSKPDGFGILGSLEGGYSFKLNNGWAIEPQAQVIYQHVAFNNTRDSYGQFSFNDGDSLRGRLGVRVSKSWNMNGADGEARLVTAWLRANVWHEFMGKTTTKVGALNGANTLPFNSYLGGTWGEIGAGVTAQVSDKVNLFATGAYNRSLDNKGRQGWDGRLGINVKW